MGAHLQMHEGNARARKFYASLGFSELPKPRPPPGGGAATGTGGELYLGIRFV